VNRLRLPNQISTHKQTVCCQVTGYGCQFSRCSIGLAGHPTNQPDQRARLTPLLLGTTSSAAQRLVTDSSTLK
jgi:hypothetical protein